MFLRSSRDYFDMHHEFHIDFLNILVDIHNESRHFLACNCLDSNMAVKHKDRLSVEEEAFNKTKSEEYLTVFATLTAESGRTLTSKSSGTVWNARCTVQAGIGCASIS
jgi:hypothetical protein